MCTDINSLYTIPWLTPTHWATHTYCTDSHSHYRLLRFFNDLRVPEHKGWNKQCRSRMFINGGDLFHQDWYTLRFCFPLRVNCRVFIWHSTPVPFIIWYSSQHNCFFSAKNDSFFVSHTFSEVYFLSFFLSFSPSGRVQINFFPHLPKQVNREHLPAMKLLIYFFFQDIFIIFYFLKIWKKNK